MDKASLLGKMHLKMDVIRDKILETLKESPVIWLLSITEDGTHCRILTPFDALAEWAGKIADPLMDVVDHHIPSCPPKPDDEEEVPDGPARA